MNKTLYARISRMPQRPRVLLLIPHLGGGGAERVIALLSRGLSPEKYELHLGLVTESAISSNLVPSWVRIHALGVRRVRSAALPLLRLVRGLQPDLILSGMAHLNFLVLLLRPLFPRKTRVVVRQNATISGDLDSRRVPGFTGFFYRLLYPVADRIVCQTKPMAADLSARLGVGEPQVKVLANPIDADAIRSLQSETESHWRGPGPHLLAVGRFSREKGFDLLLEAFASLRLKYPQAELTILGTGPELERLTAMRASLRLERSVRFAGYVSRPEGFFAGATAFVLPSRQEGLPNALLEAATGGLPLVALPASEGVVNLLAGKHGAWLGSEVSSLALTRALLAALDSIRPGQRFRHSWVEGFRMDCAIQGYELLIDEMLHEQALQARGGN
jgi:glycosyltransferase involved in cell wall biosynthesis